jgi:hypothetical protein
MSSGQDVAAGVAHQRGIGRARSADGRRRRGQPGLAAIVLAVSVLAACSATGPKAVSLAGPTATPSPPESTALTATVSPSPETTTAPAVSQPSDTAGVPGSTAAPGPCTRADLNGLEVTRTASTDTAWTLTVTLVAGPVNCVADGYPEVSLVGPGGRLMGAPADRSGPAEPPVPMLPVAVAQFTVTVSKPAAVGCQGTTTPASLRVSLPGTATAALVPLPAQVDAACVAPSAHQVTVTAVIPEPGSG